jgi:hypothetical protein
MVVASHDSITLFLNLNFPNFSGLAVGDQGAFFAGHGLPQDFMARNSASVAIGDFVF